MNIYIDTINGLVYNPHPELRRRVMGRLPGFISEKRLQIMPGDKYGYWTVVREVDKRGKERRFLCECICGKQAEVFLNNLRKPGRITGCGCTRMGNYRHGFAPAGNQHPMYASWNQMMQRCYNEANPTYRYYGARGIKVCDAWKVFSGFLQDMGDSHIYGLALGRIDHAKDYGPDNCKWVTLDESRSDRYRGD